jgi:hypothetical protein
VGEFVVECGCGGGRRGGEINRGVDAEEDERGYARVVMGKVRIFPTTISRAVAVVCDARLRHFGWVWMVGEEIVGAPKDDKWATANGKNKFSKLWPCYIS